MKFGAKYVTALDIQDKYVQVVQVRYSSRSWGVQRESLKEIPASEDGENLSRDFHTAQVVKSLLKEMGIYPPKNVVISINGRDAAVRLITLPPVRDRKSEEIEEMVKYELMMQFPVNMDQMGYDYQIMQESDGSTTIIAAIAKREVLNRHLKVLLLAGVVPDIATTSTLSLYNAFVGKEPDDIGSGGVGLICLRNSTGDAVICENGRPVSARNFALGLARDKEQLVREIRNSLGTYNEARGGEERGTEGNHHQRSPSVIHLVTEDGKLPADLTEDDLREAVPGSRWKAYAIEDNIAFGAALAGARFSPRSASLSPLRINLLKQIVREKHSEERRARKASLVKAAPVILIPILLAISVTLWWQAHRAQESIHSLYDARQANRQRAERVAELEKVEGNLEKQIGFLEWLTESYPMVSYRFYKIAQAIPDNLWLKEIYIPESKPSGKKTQYAKQAISKLYVVGYAHEQHEIERFLSALRECDCFSIVKQENTSEARVAGEKALEYRIGLTSDPVQRRSSVDVSQAEVSLDR